MLDIFMPELTSALKWFASYAFYGFGFGFLLVIIHHFSTICEGLERTIDNLKGD